MIKEKEYLNCSECPRCRPQPGLKNWQVRNMTINFVLHKYDQTEAALELQPTSSRLLERKAALEWWIVKDVKENGTPTK